MADNEETLDRFELAAQPIRARIQRKDYNYRDANQVLLAEGGLPANTPARGVDYLWGEHYKDPAQGQRAVLIAQQREHCRQWIAAGSGNCLQAFAPGQIFKHDGPALAPAPDGWLLVSVQHQGGRRDAYRNAFTATPADRPYRQALLTPAPRIAGALPARVVAPEKLTMAPSTCKAATACACLSTWTHGRPAATAARCGWPGLTPARNTACTSRCIQAPRCWSALCWAMWTGPISAAPAQLRTQRQQPRRALGQPQPDPHLANNKLRLEDCQGEEHIKLATEFDKSQLNLGHAVDRAARRRL